MVCRTALFDYVADPVAKATLFWGWLISATLQIPNCRKRTIHSILLQEYLVVERNDGTEEDEENDRQHQLALGAGDEVRQR